MSILQLIWLTQNSFKSTFVTWTQTYPNHIININESNNHHDHYINHWLKSRSIFLFICFDKNHYNSRTYTQFHTHTHTHITSTRSLERSLWFPFSDLYGGNSTFGNANTAPIHLVELDRRNGKQTKNKNSQFLNSTQVSHRQMWITQKMSQQMAVNWWFMDLMKARGLPYFELARAWIG